MSALHLRWTLVPAIPPRPLRHCSACGQPRPFASSGLFRLNANGRRLDAWLIYRCMACDRTWNRTIFERRARTQIAGEILEALQANDPELARRIECDTAGLGTLADEGESGWAVGKSVVAPGSPPLTAIRIDICAEASGPRLDRLLANELGLSRQAVARMAEEGRLAVDGGKAQDRLRRSVKDGTRLTICRLDECEAHRLAARATGRD